MAYIDLKGLKTFKTSQDTSNRGKFATIANGKVVDEQLANTLADDVVMVHVDNTSPNNPILYKDSQGINTHETVMGEFDKIYIDMDSNLNGFYYWDGTKFVLNSISDRAINDFNGEPITNYIKSFAVQNGVMTVITGNGTRTQYSVQDNIDDFIKSIVVDGTSLAFTDNRDRTSVFAINDYIRDVNVSDTTLVLTDNKGVSTEFIANNYVLPQATSNSIGGIKLYNESGDNLDGTMTQQAITGLLSSLYRFKGSISSYADLPSTNNAVGDTYNIASPDTEHNIIAGDSVSWNGTSWNKLAGSVNLTNYLKKNDTFIVSVSVDSNVLTITPSNSSPISVRLSDDYVLTPATANSIGGVKPGDYLSINQEGRLSVVTNNMELTGNPTAPTQESDDNSSKIATTKFVQTVVSQLAETAPEMLATLNQIKEQLEDSTLVDSLITQIGQKLDKSGGTITGNLTVEGTFTGNVTRAQIANTATEAVTATLDKNGNNLTSYVKSVVLTGTKLEVTDGTGSKSEYTTVDDYVLPEATYSDLGGVRLSDIPSPNLTGVPTSTTPNTDDNSTKIATTEYVKNSINKEDLVQAIGFAGYSLEEV